MTYLLISKDSIWHAGDQIEKDFVATSDEEAMQEGRRIAQENCREVGGTQPFEVLRVCSVGEFSR